MPNARYFELLPHVGIEPPKLVNDQGEPVDNPKAGELQPLQPSTLTLGVPTKVKTTAPGEPDVLIAQQTVTITPIPGTRITKVDDMLVANALAEHPCFTEIDAPKQKDLAAARKDTEAARERAEEN